MSAFPSYVIRSALKKVNLVQDLIVKAHFVISSDFWAQSRMPSSKKSKKETQKSAAAAAAAAEEEVAEQSPVELNSNNAIIIRVLAKPGAKHNSITDVSKEGVGVQVAAPPVDGEANTELIRFLASILGLRKSDLSLEKGSRSRNKSVLVAGGLSREEVLSRLQSEMGK